MERTFVLVHFPVVKKKIQHHFLKVFRMRGCVHLQRDVFLLRQEAEKAVWMFRTL